MIESIVMTKPPNLLVIHMKRFNEDLTKNCLPVLCDQVLQFTLQTGQLVTYKHISTIGHRGPTATSGHYIAHKRLIDGRCFTLNDAEVTLIKPGATFDSVALAGGGVRSETPYILFYDINQQSNAATAALTTSSQPAS